MCKYKVVLLLINEQLPLIEKLLLFFVFISKPNFDTHKGREQ